MSAKFRAEIEGMRAVAIMLVVAFHCRIAVVSGGFIGVDVFFVLSGYLISGLLLREIREKGRIDLLNFYARRMRRLLPAAAVTLALTLLLGLVCFTPGELTFAGRATRASAVYLSNVFFAWNAEDYFAPNVQANPLLHTWSLAVEEQFYLLWPIVLLVSLQWCRSTRACVASLVAIAALSFGLSVLMPGSFAFYQLPARSWEFCLGGMAAFLPPVKRTRSWRYLDIAAWLGILLPAHFYHGSEDFPVWCMIVPTLSTVIFLLSVQKGSQSWSEWILTSPPMQTIGRLSYSWYLWHWPFIIFAEALFPQISILGRMCAAAASLVIAGLTFRYVENPIRFNTFLASRPKTSLLLASAVIGLLVGASTAIMRYADRKGSTPEMLAIEKAKSDIAEMPRDKCVALSHSSNVLTCSFGDLESSTHVVLFGDSHAIQWFNPLLNIASSHHWKLTTVVKSGCSAADLPADHETGATRACSSWRREAIATMLQMKPSLVVLGSAANKPLPHSGGPHWAISGEQWRNASARTWESLTEAGLRVAVLRDTPRFRFDVPSCLGRATQQRLLQISCDMDLEEMFNPEIVDVERNLASKNSKVHLIDLTNYICPNGACAPKVGSLVTFRDADHLTGRFAESLAPRLEPLLLHALS